MNKDLDTTLKQLVGEAKRAVGEAGDERTLDDVRVRYLGKKGEVTALLKSLGQLPADERPAAGARINAAKEEVQDAIGARKHALATEQMSKTLEAERLDVTLPGRRQDAGGLHPVSQALARMEEIFVGAGYAVV